MISAPHYSAAGAKHARAFTLPVDLFDGTVNENVLHQAVKTYLANQRQGNAKAKSRSFVSGGNQKPWKQKGTGRARQGSTRAPHWRGGGVAFPPLPRSYRHEMPRKMRQLARRSAFNARAREGMVHVIDAIMLDAPRTKTLVGLLDKLALGETRTLILTAGAKPNVYLSGRNLPGLDVMPFSDASAYDILHAGAVVIESEALGTDGAALEQPEAAEAPAPPARKTAAEHRAAKASGARRVTPKARSTKPKAAKKAAHKPKAAHKTAKTAKAKPAPKKKGSK